MVERFISRGFRGRRRRQPDIAGRLPPGQYLTTDFPVLSAGPTPHAPLARWDFALTGEVDTPRKGGVGDRHRLDLRGARTLPIDGVRT